MVVDLAAVAPKNPLSLDSDGWDAMPAIATTSTRLRAHRHVPFGEMSRLARQLAGPPRRHIAQSSRSSSTHAATTRAQAQAQAQAQA
eukprot:CAMPEP_0195512322 /NCGR_PEP_ID=MMETSP0794_2-20130614/4320_1 /TAXON_ID=515487 /ORGANISM="Stephanopyxis turris, Strain CCMP 815" /LENGTH=86 /DNA_ID=CAMNT_0040640079 /DNA_START=159 /DNA_END=416 /DNA_ORIENTATION=+